MLAMDSLRVNARGRELISISYGIGLIHLGGRTEALRKGSASCV
jgi:hypothetical protein